MVLKHLFSKITGVKLLNKQPWLYGADVSLKANTSLVVDWGETQTLFSTHDVWGSLKQNCRSGCGVFGLPQQLFTCYKTSTYNVSLSYYAFIFSWLKYAFYIQIPLLQSFSSYKMIITDHTTLNPFYKFVTWCNKMHAKINFCSSLWNSSHRSAYY